MILLATYHTGGRSRQEEDEGRTLAKTMKKKDTETRNSTNIKSAHLLTRSLARSEYSLSSL
jgi:hypothetical protein